MWPALNARRCSGSTATSTASPTRTSESPGTTCTATNDQPSAPFLTGTSAPTWSVASSAGSVDAAPTTQSSTSIPAPRTRSTARSAGWSGQAASTGWHAVASSTTARVPSARSSTRRT
ncbi:hypothetical protein BC477_10620 [Clavibacter michiganensis subsp. michiganensis]|uniref:Uncharacterized protein n=1 Tax=Clavibacter michiganensis subsp. michiganensis TaxID=33013 RepID=A0A251XPN3_CLAMM|nr:hypothetical protein BC477_10620 [Clavibacter michiganensis subsp. michiganensis]OUE05179.1 hypothetical protein CMMCAS07_09540 [Clavibacter michiganensis subsp. michiganensis]